LEKRGGVNEEKTKAAPGKNDYKQRKKQQKEEE